MSVREVFRNVRAALEDADIRYMVTGSFASSVHGVPRATNDIDIVIEPTREQLAMLMSKFVEPDYDAHPEEALDALKRRSMFSVIDRRGIWKIDFIIRKDRPFSKKEFDRRRMIKIMDVMLYAATPKTFSWPSWNGRSWASPNVKFGMRQAYLKSNETISISIMSNAGRPPWT